VQKVATGLYSKSSKLRWKCRPCLHSGPRAVTFPRWSLDSEGAHWTRAMHRRMSDAARRRLSDSISATIILAEAALRQPSAASSPPTRYREDPRVCQGMSLGAFFSASATPHRQDSLGRKREPIRTTKADTASPGVASFGADSRVIRAALACAPVPSSPCIQVPCHVPVRCFA
jgi:hypothetical protein